jgi:hypothetical protein
MDSGGQQTDLWKNPIEEQQEFPAVQAKMNISNSQLLMVNETYFRINNAVTTNEYQDISSTSRWYLRKHYNQYVHFDKQPTSQWRKAKAAQYPTCEPLQKECTFHLGELTEI